MTADDAHAPWGVDLGIELRPSSPGPAGTLDVRVIRNRDNLSEVSPAQRWSAPRALLTVHPEDLRWGTLGTVRARHWQSWDFLRAQGGRLYPAPRLQATVTEDLPPLPAAPPDQAALLPERWREAVPAVTRLDYADRQGKPSLRLTVGRAAPDHLVLHLESLVPGAERLVLGYRTPPDEVLSGFGMRTHAVPHRGRLDLWVEEGPLGLGWLSPWLAWTGRVPLPKGPNGSCAPMPVWFSSAGYVAWIDTSARVIVRLGPTRRTFEVWSSHARLHLLAAQDPESLLARLSDCLGRPAMPPPWALGPWHDSVRGSPAALATAHRLRDARVPSSALWIEDFMGSQEDRRRFWMRPLTHAVDRTLYPDLPRLAGDLRGLGMRLLGYVCPEVSEGTALYRQAESGGHLACRPDGRPARVTILGNHYGEFDLSREATRAFVQAEVLTPLADLGFDGWMADYGEYFPLSARLASGESGFVEHNRYPVRWQALMADFWRQRRPDGDAVFFSRSAHLGSQAAAQILWGGDLDTDFAQADGLPCVPRQFLSAALSGLPLVSTDAGGYMTFGLTRPRTRALYLRWLEAAALAPVLRTHHGMARPRNWQWDRDKETVRIHARYARLHTALFPYLYRLVRDACARGTPVLRPVAFLDVACRDLWRVDDAFLCGPDLLVAPILGPRQERRVVLPRGVWRAFFTGQCVKGPARIRVDAPLDHLPLFVRSGAVIPVLEGRFWLRFAESPTSRQPVVCREDAASPLGSPAAWEPEGIVDTLDDRGDPPLVHLGVADQAVTLYFDAPGENEVHLHDGTHLAIRIDPRYAAASHGPETAAFTVFPPAVRDHLPAFPQTGLGVRLGPGEEVRLTIATFTVHLACRAAPRVRLYVLRPWGRPSADPHTP